MGSVKHTHLLVAGGTGFIGSHVIKRARELRWKVDSLSLKPPKRVEKQNGVNYLIGDIADLESLKSLFLDKKYSYVVNLSGYIDHRKFFEDGASLFIDHFKGLQNLVESLDRGRLIRLIQIGSSDEYGNQPAPQHESYREQPISPYSAAKVAATHFLQMLNRAEGYPGVVLRLFLTYGPGQSDDRLIPQVVRGCLQDKKFPVSKGEQYRDFCYVDDTIDGIFKTLKANNVDGQVINIASGKPVCIREVIEIIKNRVGKGNPQYGDVPYRPGENMSLYASIDRATDLISWAPKTSLEGGIYKTIDWIKAE